MFWVLVTLLLNASRSRRRTTRRVGHLRITADRRYAPFEIGKRVDQLACLERPIAASGTGFRYDPRRFEDGNRIIRRLERNAEESFDGSCGDDRGLRQTFDEREHRCVGTHVREPRSPRVLKLSYTPFEPFGVVDRTGTRAGKQPDPAVRRVHRSRG